MLVINKLPNNGRKCWHSEGANVWRVESWTWMGPRQSRPYTQYNMFFSRAERVRQSWRIPADCRVLLYLVFFFFFLTKYPSPHSLQSCSWQWRWLNCGIINPTAQFLFIGTTCHFVSGDSGWILALYFHSKSQRQSHCSIPLRKDVQ